eukprot:g29492.t2
MNSSSWHLKIIHDRFQHPSSRPSKGLGRNDFIGAEKNYNPFAQGNFWIPHVTFGFRKKALEVLSNLEAFLKALADLGCQNFLVSDLPFTSVVPALQMARLARVNKRGRWMSQEMEKMLKDIRDFFRHEDRVFGKLLCSLWLLRE